MSRSVPEWIAKSDDTPVPPRVRLRIFKRYGGRCQCGCGTEIGSKPWDAEDEIAIINGGARRESNLRPFLAAHHPQKTRRDVAIKSKTYRMAARHAGIRRTAKGRPMAGTKASGISKPFNGPPVYRDSGKPVGSRRERT